MVTDPIGDFIVRLKNAGDAKKHCAVAPYSKLRHAIAAKLKQNGYIGDIAKKGKKTRKVIEMELKYNEAGAHAISGVKRVSKPGRRQYQRAHAMYPVKFGKGTLILSTPKGILTDKEARKEKIGGEALFEIW